MKTFIDNRELLNALRRIGHDVKIFETRTNYTGRTLRIQKLVTSLFGFKYWKTILKNSDWHRPVNFETLLDFIESSNKKCEKCGSKDTSRAYYSSGYNNLCKQAYGSPGVHCMKCMHVTFDATFEERTKRKPEWCTVTR